MFWSSFAQNNLERGSISNGMSTGFMLVISRESYKNFNEA